MKDSIIETLTRIETKLDEVIAALHAYDDDNIYSGYDEPNEALLKAAGLYNEEINKKYGESSFEAFIDSKDDILNWKVGGAERRIHHVTNEEADEDANNNTQGKDKRTGGDKKRTAKDRRKYYKPKQTK